MALDGLSNQSVGIYRTKGPSEKVDKMAAKYKEKAEFNLANVEETTTIDKVDADERKKQNNDDATKELILSKANDLVEKEDEVLELVVEDEEKSVELKYSMKFNSKTNMIEMINEENKELIETIKPEELMKVLSKAKSIAGVLVDREI